MDRLLGARGQLLALLLTCLLAQLPTALSQVSLQSSLLARVPSLLGSSNTTAPAAARQGADPQPAQAAPATSKSQVIINELMSDNEGVLKDEDGSTPDWVELLNTGSSPISLQGYKLTDERDASKSWAIPAVTLGAGQFLVVYLSGKDRADPSKQLHADFKISKDGDYLALLDPSGAVATAVDYPKLKADQPFGVAGAAGLVSAQQERSAPVYAILATPTPGQPNSGPSPGGPLVLRTTHSPTPQPDTSRDIVVSATVQPVQNPVTGVSLVYVVGYGAENVVPMTENLYGTYSAVIPAAQLTPGALVRWFVKAIDSQGQVTRDPPFVKPTDRQYYGTIIADPSDSSNLFVLEMYCPLENAPVNETATKGCSLLINGTYYDNVEVSRRGVTSLQWPKPKIKIDSKQGQIFKLLKGWHRVNELNLNGGWAEPGENTFMREPLVWKTFREAGVEALVAFHMHVRFNGKYFGRFAYSEQIEDETLQRWGYSITSVGPLWKSTSGEFSNLRWDVPPEHIQFYWKKYTRKRANDDQALLDFTRGISGGGPVVRSKYLFDAVNLPQVVNHMAAQTMILNQDRCTKNFWIYLDLTSQQWSMLPWDVESGFGIDRGLGGQPAPDYCILACDQWNSPLYCDHNHPQDLAVKTPWGLISAQYPSWNTQGRRRLQGAEGGCSDAASSDPLARAARKMLQAGAGAGAAGPSVALVDGNAGAPANGAALAGQLLPANSTITPDYDEDKTKQVRHRRMLKQHQQQQPPTGSEAGDKGSSQTKAALAAPYVPSAPFQQAPFRQPAAAGRGPTFANLGSVKVILPAPDHDETNSTAAAAGAKPAAKQQQPPPSLHGLNATTFLSVIDAMKGPQPAAAAGSVPRGLSAVSSFNSSSKPTPSPAPASSSSSQPLSASPSPLPSPPSPGHAAKSLPTGPPTSSSATQPPTAVIPHLIDASSLDNADLTMLGGVKAEVNTHCPTTTGAPGTFNYLIDAILAVPRTRQMYMRRLRTLMDQFIASGRLEAIVREMHGEIRDEAKRDVAKWQNPGDPDRGFQQLITEQLPIRKDQLYNTYGPKGVIPLIPDAQPSNPKLQLGKLEAGDSGYVEVANPNDFAVDISGYSLGGAAQFVFRAGTVIPAQDSAFVAANINAFKQRGASPKGGEGRFVVGPFSGQVMGPGASVSLSDRQGNVIASS